jgi:hypothetical protein
LISKRNVIAPQSKHHKTKVKNIFKPFFYFIYSYIYIALKYTVFLTFKNHLKGCMLQYDRSWTHYYALNANEPLTRRAPDK